MIASRPANLSQVGRVCVTVADTDRAIDFYVDTLGFEKVVDIPMDDSGMRWVEVALPRHADDDRARAAAAGQGRGRPARPGSSSTRPTLTPTTPR